MAIIKEKLEGRAAAADTGTGGAQAIRRAMDVIRAVAQLRSSGATLSRVAQVTGLNTSTTFRILRTLTEERMLKYEEAERNYYVGPLAFELGLSVSSGAQVQARWREAVEHVARQTRLTTYLMARSDNDGVCLLCVQGSMAIRAMPMDVGQRLPLGIGAGSVAILSALDDEEVQRIVASHRGRLDVFPGGRQEVERIPERVALTRERGFSLTSATVAQGLTGVGVPILPRRGLMQLAISVSAVADIMDVDEGRKIAGVIFAAIQKAAQTRPDSALSSIA